MVIHIFFFLPSMAPFQLSAIVDWGTRIQVSNAACAFVLSPLFRLLVNRRQRTWAIQAAASLVAASLEAFLAPLGAALRSGADLWLRPSPEPSPAAPPC